MNESIPPDTLGFSLSGMDREERRRLEGLQKLLDLPDIWHAGAFEMAIIRVIEQRVERPYDGWFGDLTPEQRTKLSDYIEQNKGKIASIYNLSI